MKNWIVPSLISFSVFSVFSSTVFAYSKTEVIKAAIKNEYPSAQSVDSSYSAGPLSLIGNLAMELQPAIRRIGGSQVRDYEVMRTASFTVEGTSFECVALVKSKAPSSALV